VKKQHPGHVHVGGEGSRWVHVLYICSVCIVKVSSGSLWCLSQPVVIVRLGLGGRCFPTQPVLIAFQAEQSRAHWDVRAGPASHIVSFGRLGVLCWGAEARNPGCWRPQTCPDQVTCFDLPLHQKGPGLFLSVNVCLCLCVLARSGVLQCV
jgi:hypothetical protein